MNNKINFLFVLIIFTAGILGYANSFDCSFQFDDQNVFHSSVTESSSSIRDWVHLFPNRPVGILTFFGNFQLHGLDVWGYHLVNLIIHLINAFLVWYLTLLTLSTPVMKNAEISNYKVVIGFLVGLLFVTHPLATQSVTYIVQRFTSLATLFYLLSILLFVRGRLWQGNRKVVWFLYGFSILSAVLGMLSKEIAFTLPFAILLYEFCFLKHDPLKWRIKDEGLIIPMVIIFLFSIQALRILSLKHFGTIPPIQGYAYSISMKEYFFTQFSVILTYIRLFVLPIHQNFDYDYPIATAFFQLRTIVSFLLLMLILTAGAVFFKKHRMISFGIFWFFLTLSVESSIMPISQNVIFEHRTYLPGFGFFIALIAAFFSFFKRQYIWVAVTLLLAFAATNAVMTYQRNKIWKNEYTFWADSLKKSPHKARPNNNFGLALFAQGKVEEAVQYYDKALRITPDFIFFYNNRGAAYAKLGRYREAIDDYNEAIRLQPDHPGAYYNRAIAYSDLGDYKKALEDYRVAIRLGSRFTDAYVNLANIFSRFGQYQQAIEKLTEAVQHKSKDPKIYYNRGINYAKLGQHEFAIKDYNRALKINPKEPDAYYNRGNAYAALGQTHNAIGDWTRAIHLKPSFAEAYNNRGTLYFMTGNAESGCHDAKKACEMGICKALDWALKESYCR